jgi:hypothetical protein
MADNADTASAGFTPIRVIPVPPLPTMRIVSREHDAGYIIINESDFDAATMTRWTSSTEPAKASAKGKSAKDPASE